MHSLGNSDGGGWSSLKTKDGAWRFYIVGDQPCVRSTCRPSSLSPLPCPKFPVPCPGLLPPVPCSKFPVPSLLPPVPCPPVPCPVPCPQFPVPTSLSQVPCAQFAAPSSLPEVDPIGKLIKTCAKHGEHQSPAQWLHAGKQHPAENHKEVGSPTEILYPNLHYNQTTSNRHTKPTFSRSPKPTNDKQPTNQNTGRCCHHARTTGRDASENLVHCRPQNQGPKTIPGSPKWASPVQQFLCSTVQLGRPGGPLRELELQGWETLPIAILGMPNLPPAWVIETWKPVGGCKFTGYFSGVAGNSALRFCLLLKWRAIRPQATELFPAQLQGDSLSCLPAEDNDADVESVSTPSSNTSARRADRLTKAIERDSTKGSQAPDPSPCIPCPQLLSPPLFVPWSQVAKLRGVVELHKDIEACPYEQLQAALAHPKCLVPGEKEQFLQANNDLLCQLQGSFMPLEGIAPQVFEAIYQRQQGEILWVTVLWMIARINEYWIGYDIPPLPSVFQINCGGLGGEALEGDVPPHFHCMCPPVGESQVYGPSLSPADVTKEQEYGVAYGCSTGVHEVATLFVLTQNPCQKWEDLGYGKAALLYQRTQHVLKAARLLPAHRRLPHQAFLSGLWWKLLSLQPLRLIAYLPVLGCLRPAEQADLTHFTVNGFSAGSYTGAVIALAIRCLWPASQITARLGAIAMPKSVLAALVATAEPDRRNYYLVHAAEDCLCDWKPTADDLDMLQRSLHVTYVEDSARWMGKHKHCYWRWLQCQLPRQSQSGYSEAHAPRCCSSP